MRKPVIILSANSLIASTMLWTTNMTAVEPCHLDGQCRDGFYCISSVCQECYDCTKYYMHPTEDCSKSITACGDCLAGYVPADNKLEGCVSPKSSTLPYWPALVAFFVALALVCCLLGLVVRRILRKKSRSADLIHPRPGLVTTEDKTSPTAPPSEECARLNPGDVEARGAERLPAADPHSLQNEDSAPLMDTSPPPYSTVLNEIRTSDPSGVARAPGGAIAHDHPPPNGLNISQYDRHALDTPVDNLSDSAARRPWAQNGNARNYGWPSSHPRSLRGHPKDSRILRENDLSQRARKYNNPVYDDNQNVPENTVTPNDSNDVPEWLQDDTTTESTWTPHAPPTADSAPPNPAASAGVAYPSISNATQPEASNRNAFAAGLPRVRVTTRARSDDEGPQRSRRRVATDNERAVVLRSGGDGAPSPPGPSDDLTPEEDGRRPLYNYSIINIQPELSIVAKIDL